MVLVRFNDNWELVKFKDPMSALAFTEDQIRSCQMYLNGLVFPKIRDVRQLVSLCTRKNWTKSTQIQIDFWIRYDEVKGSEYNFKFRLLSVIPSAELKAYFDAAGIPLPCDAVDLTATIQNERSALLMFCFKTAVGCTYLADVDPNSIKLLAKQD